MLWIGVIIGFVGIAVLSAATTPHIILWTDEDGKVVEVEVH